MNAAPPRDGRSVEAACVHFDGERWSILPWTAALLYAENRNLALDMERAEAARDVTRRSVAWA